MSELETKTGLLLKAALDFNSSVIALATKVLATKDAKARTVGRELSVLFEKYHGTVSAILREPTVS